MQTPRASLFTAKTPKAKEGMRSWMMRHAAELERDGHHDLAAAARLNAMSPRMPLSAKASTNVPPTSATKTAKGTPMQAFFGLRAWLDAHPDMGDATEGTPLAVEYLKSPSVVGYNDDKDADIDDEMVGLTVRAQLAALRDGVLRQLGGKDTPGLERDVVPRSSTASPTDAMWRHYENGGDGDEECEAEPPSPSVREASDAIWAMWEAEQAGLAAAEAAMSAAAGVEDALQQRVTASHEAARFPRSPLTGFIMLSLYVAAAAACAALIAFPTSADANHASASPPASTLQRSGDGHALPLVRACADSVVVGHHGPAAALAMARCAGADAVRAVLKLWRMIGRLLKGGRKSGAAKPLKPGQK